MKTVVKTVVQILSVTIALACCRNGAWAADAPPAGTATPNSPAAAQSTQSTDALLQALSTASLADSADIVEKLAESGGRNLLPLFQAMQEGELYYSDSAKSWLRVRDDNGTDKVTTVLDGKDFGADSSDRSKIRVNNRLRTLLGETIARIKLTQGSPAERKAAALAMLESIDDTSAALFEQAQAKEADADVKQLMQIGIAMFTLADSSDDDVQLKAIATLSGRLDTPVRNLLASFQAGGAHAGASAAVRAAANTALAKIQGKIDFYQFIEQLFFGLSLGSVLLLAAIGLAVTFGVMGVINMAHGEMLMLGAYTTYVVQLLMPNSIDYSLYVAVPAAFLVSALVGMIIQRFVIRYLNGRPLETLLATFGISLILQQGVRTIFSPLNRLVQSPSWMSGSLQINPVMSLTYNRLYILVFALVVFALLVVILKKTSLGLYVRAVSQNRAMAQAMGVRTDVVDALTFGLGSGIAGIAGVALSQLTNVGPNLGQSYIIDSFMVVVFGGVGNLIGTLVAAVSLGIINKFLEEHTGAVLANILILVFIILFIQKKPKGLFPQKGRAAE
ncbi:MAG TPA: urea ABC transporter permease subunit UrtB [Candidatus Acidoferrum sp.]|nr:urea ABC transporter permease subunit UrtB [Candidatus Acidoferrum sp.]